MFGCGPRKKNNEEEEHDRRFNKAIKLLLLGTGESGKTTIIKQMKILHINGFSEQEKKEKIPFIKQNIHESIYDILHAMERINPPVQVEHLNKEDAKFILDLGPEKPEYSQEYFDHVKKLWADKGVQEAFQRSNEFQLIDSAQHFLDRIDEIRQANYLPTLQDILFCRIKTTGISEIEFNVPLPKMYGGGRADFLMYDVGGQRGERRKWIQVFDGINAILFIIAASDFDQTLREDESKNRLEEAFSVFADICTSRFLRSAGIIVFLNKQDIFRKKIEQGRKLEKYFPTYQHSTEIGSESEFERAKLFLEKKVIEISRTEVKVKNFNPIKRTVIEEKLPPREVYIHHTIATDTNNVKKVFESVQEMIIKNVIKSISNY